MKVNGWYILIGWGISTLIVNQIYKKRKQKEKEEFDKVMAETDRVIKEAEITIENNKKAGEEFDKILDEFTKNHENEGSIKENKK